MHRKGEKEIISDVWCRGCSKVSSGTLLAKELVTRGLQTTQITESAVFAMISHANMAIVAALAVMANGRVTAY